MWTSLFLWCFNILRMRRRQPSFSTLLVVSDGYFKQRGLPHGDTRLFKDWCVCLKTSAQVSSHFTTKHTMSSWFSTKLNFTPPQCSGSSVSCGMIHIRALCDSTSRQMSVESCQTFVFFATDFR